MFNFIHYTNIFVIVPHNCLQCSFQVSFSSIITPRYLYVTVLSIAFLFKFITKDSVLTCLFVINIYFVLEMFSESLFAISQSTTFVISWLTEFCNFPRLLSLWTNTVSSAKSILFIEFDFGKSFTNIKKNSGPKIDPWGAYVKQRFVAADGLFDFVGRSSRKRGVGAFQNARKTVAVKQNL